jgi:CHAT domain-containing protein
MHKTSGIAAALVVGLGISSMVHFAGHGVAEENPGNIPTYSILLEDGRLDLTTWLGFAPPRFESHPSFLNSCDVGRSHRVANFVEGWAPAALELGACGTIGALWPIDDAGAAAFALEFYTRLWGEGPQHGRVAAALRESRRALLDQGNPLGLAYVFYGDPSLTLEL